MMENRSLAWRKSERGFFTLIALLVVILIIGILYATQFGGGKAGRGGGGAQTALGGAVQRADDTVCRNNLQQIRTAIQIHQGNTGSFPPTLEALQINVSVPLACPLGGEPYQYDASTGAVHCVHPGHESF